MRVTIKDIAKIAGVSVSTVSMVLNNRKGVSEKTRKQVKKIAKNLNYYPNINARSLKTDKTSTLGLVVPNIINPFFALVVDMVRQVAEKEEYTLLLGISGSKIKNEQKYINEFILRNVEGIIIVPILEKNDDLSHLYYLKNQQIPFVFLTANYEGISADCSMTDLFEGSYLLTHHLLTRGHRKIFMIAADRQLQPSYMRINGYKKAYSELKLEYSEEWIFETVPDFAHGVDIARQLVKKKPDAIITINDFLALGVLKLLNDLQIKVPDEISVAGYDDLLFASITETPLTTVRQPVEKICKKGVNLVIDRINDESKEYKTYYFKPELKIRSSTR